MKEMIKTQIHTYKINGKLSNRGKQFLFDITKFDNHHRKKEDTYTKHKYKQHGKFSSTINGSTIILTFLIIYIE